MIRVMGIDIPRGYAVIDVPQTGQSIGAICGELDEGREVEHAAELMRKHGVHRVAIETPLKPYRYGRGGIGNSDGVRLEVGESLISCARLAGRIEQQAIVMGLPVVVADADTVRGALGIRGKTRTQKDQAVKAYVMTHVRGWPAKSNTDERDAAAVAVYGGKTIVEVKRGQTK